MTRPRLTAEIWQIWQISQAQQPHNSRNSRNWSFGGQPFVHIALCARTSAANGKHVTKNSKQRFNLLRFVIKVTCSSQMWMVLDDCHGHHVCRLHIIEIKPASHRTSINGCESCQGTPMWATLHGAEPSEFTRLSLAGGRFKCLQSGVGKPEFFL